MFGLEAVLGILVELARGAVQPDEDVAAAKVARLLDRAQDPLIAASLFREVGGEAALVANRRGMPPCRASS